MSEDKLLQDTTKQSIYTVPNWAMPLMDAKTKLNRVSNLAEENKLLEACKLTQEVISSLEDVGKVLREAVNRQKALEAIIEKNKPQELA